MKEQSASYKQRVTYIRQQKQHILKKHQALQVEQFSIRNALDKTKKELEYCKEKQAKAKESMAFIKNTVAPLRVDMQKIELICEEKYPQVYFKLKDK